MRILLDQGLPRSAAGVLCGSGIAAMHTADLGLARVDDEAILEFARAHSFEVVVTLDADFHALMALSGERAPSVIRIRIEGLRAHPLAELITMVLSRCRDDIQRGALVSVEEGRIRLRHLPIGRHE